MRPMRCVVALSAALLLTAALSAGEAQANPALVAAKAAQAAQAASRAAQAGRAASAASRMGRMGKMGRIGSKAMRRVMTGRNLGGGTLKPGSLRLRQRMQRALRQRGLRDLQKVAGQRNKNFRQLMKKRMGSLRSGGAVKNFARNQVQKRMQTVNRMAKDRKFTMRKLQQSLQRRNRAESNQRDADRRRSMRSHAAEMRRRSVQSGVFKSAMLRQTRAR